MRAIVDALTGFEPKDQERIIRWAQEKIGLIGQHNIDPIMTPPVLSSHIPPSGHDGRVMDIRSFVDSKRPQSDNQFAAAVAYYYRFEAAETERKMSITADDLQDAARQAGRDRFARPAQTLVNAHGQGYLDKADRGQYALNTVGENLVAMALPQSTDGTRRTPTPRRRNATKVKRATQKKK